MKKILKRLIIFTALVFVVGIFMLRNYSQKELYEITEIKEVKVLEDDSEIHILEDFEYCYASKTESELTEGFDYNFVRFARAQGVVEGDFNSYPYKTNASEGFLTGEYEGEASLPIKITLTDNWTSKEEQGTQDQSFEFEEQKVTVMFTHMGELLESVSHPKVDCLEYKNLLQEAKNILLEEVDLGELIESHQEIYTLENGWVLQTKKSQYENVMIPEEVTFSIQTERSEELIYSVSNLSGGISGNKGFGIERHKPFISEVYHLAGGPGSTGYESAEHDFYIYTGNLDPQWYVRYDGVSAEYEDSKVIEDFFVSKANDIHIPNEYKLKSVTYFDPQFFFVVYENKNAPETQQQGYVILERSDSGNYGPVVGGGSESLAYEISGIGSASGDVKLIFQVKETEKSDWQRIRLSSINGDYLLEDSIGYFNTQEYFYNKETIQDVYASWTETFVPEENRSLSHPEDWLVDFDDEKGFVTMIPPVYEVEKNGNYIGRGIPNEDVSKLKTQSCVGNSTVSACAIGTNSYVNLVFNQMMYGYGK